MDEDFSRQTRRFSAAILTYGKGKRRRMAGKRPLRRRSTVVNTGSKSPGDAQLRQNRLFPRPHLGLHRPLVQVVIAQQMQSGMCH